MRWIAKGLKWTALLLGATLAMAAVWVIAEIFRSPRYDDGNPRYAAIEQQIDAIGQRRGNALGSPASIDFSALDDGRWTTVCLFGGYQNPSEEMAKRHAVISDADRARLREAREIGFRLAEVEEYELMIAYVDEGNQAHFIHFSGGFGSGSQHFEKCIAKPSHVLVIY